MKTKLTSYRESIAKMRYYLAQLSGGGAGGDWAQKAAQAICVKYIDPPIFPLEANANAQKWEDMGKDVESIIAEHAPDQSAQLKYAALLTYELNRLPYQPPRPRKSFLTRILNRIQK